MTKLIGKKMKMTHVFKDGRAYGVTPVKLETDSDVTSFLNEGDLLKISGITKGRGFTGVVKRWNFAGGPASHGQKHSHRAPGSIGSQAPQRVIPGKKMAGHMGMNRVTYRNIKLIELDPENKIIFLNGSVPGTIGRKVEIVSANDIPGAATKSSEQEVEEKKVEEPKNEKEEVKVEENKKA